MILPFLILFFTGFSAQAIGILPIEVVEAAPIDFFSERADMWPTETISTDYLIPDQSLFEELGSFSNISTRGSLSAGNPHISIRGSQEYARSLLVYNGAPLNLLDGTGANPLLLPNENIHNVTVLKGPASVMYGSDAVGGAIQFTPHKYTKNMVRGAVGSFDRKSIYVASPLINKDDHRLQFTGFLNSTDGDFSYEQAGTTQKRASNNSHLQRITFTGHNYHSGFLVKPTFVYAQNFGASPGPVNSPYVNTFNRTALLESIVVEKNIGAKDKFHFRTTYIRNEDYNTDTVLNSKTKWFASQISNTLSFKRTFSNELSADFFADFYYNEFENKPNTIKRYFSDRTEPGVILKYVPDKDYYASPGFRYLPETGLLIKSIVVGQTMDNYNAWISYSEGFRDPSFTQLYYQSSFFVGNPNLKPEKSNQIELGVSKELSPNPNGLWDRMSYEIATYTIDYTDFIEYVGSPATYVNSGNVNVLGVDVTAGFNYKIWSLLFLYSYMNGTNDTTNAPLILTPTNKFSYTVGTQLGPVVAELTQTHWSPYYLTSTIKSGSWDVFDITIRTLGLSDWVIKCNLQNIFDNKRQFTLNYPEPGRNFLLSAERSF